MKQMRHLVRVLGIALACCCVSTVVGKLDYGLGVLMKVRNDTPFPLEFYADADRGGEGVGGTLNALPEGAIIRLRSLRYPSKPYFRVKKIGNRPRLIADGTDGNDPATHLVVVKHRDAKGKDWIGFKMRATGDIADYATMKSPKGTCDVRFEDLLFHGDEFMDYQWTFSPPTPPPPPISLVNRGTGGALVPGALFDFSPAKRTKPIDQYLLPGMKVHLRALKNKAWYMSQHQQGKWWFRARTLEDIPASTFSVRRNGEQVAFMPDSPAGTVVVSRKNKAKTLTFSKDLKNKSQWFELVEPKLQKDVSVDVINVTKLKDKKTQKTKTKKKISRLECYLKNVLYGGHISARSKNEWGRLGRKGLKNDGGSGIGALTAGKAATTSGPSPSSGFEHLAIEIADDPYLRLPIMPDGAAWTGRPGVVFDDAYWAITDAIEKQDWAGLELETLALPEPPAPFSLMGGAQQGTVVAAHGNHAAMLTAQGVPYYMPLNGKAWQELARAGVTQGSAFGHVQSPLTHLDIGADQTLVAVGWNYDEALGGGEVYQYVWAQKVWQKLPGRMRLVGVGSNAHVWGIDAKGLVYRFQKGGWTRVAALPNDAKAQDIGVGEDGTVWVVDDSRRLFLWTTGGWTLPNAQQQALSVAVGNKDNVIAIMPNYQMYKLVQPAREEGRNQTWRSINGILIDAALSSNGTVVALGGKAGSLGFDVLSGNAGQESEIEPKNSFDPTPYRLPKRAGGNLIKANELKDLADFGYKDGVFFRRNPEVRGYTYEILPNFSRGFLLTLPPLWGQGFAWIQESLKTPGKATVCFRARASDNGDLHVVFGEGVGTKCMYKAVIGGMNNTRSAILKFGQDVMAPPVSIDRDPRARATPGTFDQYWVSVNTDEHGFFMVGRGEPGTNIFMASPDPNPFKNPAGRPLIDRIGFSTFNSLGNVAAEITEVVVLPELSFKTEGRELVQEPQARDLQKGKGFWVQTAFRPVNKACVTFKARGDGELRIRLFSKTDKPFEGYEVRLRTKGAWASRILRHAETVETLVSENNNFRIPLMPAQDTTFWVNIDENTISLGYGDRGKNPIMVWEDYRKLTGINRVGFLCAEGSVKISNVVISQPLHLGFSDPTMSYAHEQDRFKFNTSVAVVNPFRYEMFQDRQAVSFRDLITGQGAPMGATPQQDKRYPFRLSIATDGTPGYQLLDSGKESDEKVALSKASYILQATSQTMAMVSGAVAFAGIGGQIASLALGAGSIATGTAAAKIQSDLEYAYRTDDSYVFVENAPPRKQATSDVPIEAQNNLARAQEELAKADLLNAGTADGFVALMRIYQNVLFMANNYFVTGDDFVKRKIFQGLDILYDAYANMPIETYNDLLDVFASAYNNLYLIDPTNKNDAQRRMQWSLVMSDVISALYKDEARNAAGIKVRGMFGEYLWLPVDLQIPGHGAISFEVRGMSDALVAFGQEPYTTRNTNREIYEIAIGSWDNTRTVLRTQSLGSAEVTLTREKNPLAMLDARNFRKFWINVHDGRVTLGHDDPGDETILFNWTDPQPIPGIHVVGISCWNTEVTFRNIQILPRSLLDEAPAEGEGGGETATATSAGEESGEAQEARTASMTGGVGPIAVPQSTVSTGRVAAEPQEQRQAAAAAQQAQEQQEQQVPKQQSVVSSATKILASQGLTPGMIAGRRR